MITVPILVPGEMLDLVRELAHFGMVYHDMRNKAVGMTPEEAKEFMLMKFPSIQGWKNQRIMREIGNKPFDLGRSRVALDWLHDRDQKESSMKREFRAP